MMFPKKKKEEELDDLEDYNPDDEINDDDIFQSKNNKKQKYQDEDDDPFYNEDLGFDNYGDVGMPTPMEKHSDLLKSLTNFDKFIKDKINGWLGVVWDQQESKYMKSKTLKPIMNEDCASWCVDFLKTYARDNNIITDIGKEEYRNIVEDIIDVVWFNLGTRSEEFGITNNGDILKVCVEMQHSAELVLMGAGDGKYNKLLSTATSRTEHINNAGQQQLYPSFNGQMDYQQGQAKKQGFLQKMKKIIVGSG